MKLRPEFKVDQKIIFLKQSELEPFYDEPTYLISYDVQKNI